MKVFDKNKLTDKWKFRKDYVPFSFFGTLFGEYPVLCLFFAAGSSFIGVDFDFLVVLCINFGVLDKPSEDDKTKAAL